VFAEPGEIEIVIQPSCARTSAAWRPTPALAPIRIAFLPSRAISNQMESSDGSEIA
jgi:hypothetical protein